LALSLYSASANIYRFIERHYHRELFSACRFGAAGGKSVAGRPSLPSKTHAVRSFVSSVMVLWLRAVAVVQP
jgi:hypothetical protein